MDFNGSSKKFWWAICLLGLVLVFLIVLFVSSKPTKTQVELLVAPSDSIVQVDGKEVTDSSVSLEPGEYTFTAKREMFEEAVITVEVGTEDTTVYLLPEPVSNESKRFLIDNPSEQKLREDIGGQQAAEKGESFRSKNSIADILPRIDFEGPYAIDYGTSDHDENRALIVVSDSSPKGRQNALKWLREQGHDPVDYEIVFYDYTNVFQAYAEGE